MNPELPPTTTTSGAMNEAVDLFEGHTEGPWYVRNGQEVYSIEQYAPTGVIPRIIGYVLFSENAPQAEFEEQLKNAHLFAAAPTLLTENRAKDRQLAQQAALHTELDRFFGAWDKEDAAYTPECLEKLRAVFLEARQALAATAPDAEVTE